MPDPVISWFRRDLRLANHAALCAALEANAPVMPVYVMDDEMPGRAFLLSFPRKRDSSSR